MFRTISALGLLVATQILSAATLEPAYLAMGIGNTQEGFTIPIKINSAQIAAMTDLYVTAQYAPLSASTQLTTGPAQRVKVGVLPGKISFIAVTVKGLNETTVYRARVNLYRGNGIHVATSGFYYTTTTGNDPKSLIRTRMILKGMKEFYDSEQGLVGKNGTFKVDGTKYGADPGEAWCSEFYSWVGKGNLKKIDGLSSFNKLIEYFRVANGLHNRSAIPTVARRGDYVAMDTDGVNGTNHSGMFLAFEKASDGEFVWTLEGNSGNKIKVHRRPYNKVFTALGHIMKDQF